MTGLILGKGVCSLYWWPSIILVIFQRQHIVKPVYVLKKMILEANDSSCCFLRRVAICSMLLVCQDTNGTSSIFMVFIGTYGNVQLPCSTAEKYPSSISGVQVTSPHMGSLGVMMIYGQMFLTEINTTEPHPKYIRVQLANPPPMTTTLNAFVYFVRSKTGRVFPGLGKIQCCDHKLLRFHCCPIKLAKFQAGSIAGSIKFDAQCQLSCWRFSMICTW